MALGDQYRARAAELMAKAQGEFAPAIRREYENLGLAYLRLAEQADRNAFTDVVYEHAPEQPGVPPSPQPSEDGTDD